MGGSYALLRQAHKDTNQQAHRALYQFVSGDDPAKATKKTERRMRETRRGMGGRNNSGRRALRTLKTID